MPVFGLGQTIGSDTAVEELATEPSGVIELRGWTRLTSADVGELARLFLDELDFEPAYVLRTLRPELVEQERVGLGAGFVAQFLAQEGSYKRLRVIWGGASLFDQRLELVLQTPPYDNLLAAERPLRRSDIYGSGPPAPVLSADIAAASKWLQGRVLDFGCGAGALVQHLRSRGIDASGLEVDRSDLRGAILPRAAPYVSFYDGRLPSPPADAAFDSVACIEVLEHIEEYGAALDELARITRDMLVLTTPDLSAIPLLHRHHVVPWHLLEATHVSFFTQASLTAELSRRFECVELFRFGINRVNETVYYTSLLAILPPTATRAFVSSQPMLGDLFGAVRRTPAKVIRHASTRNRLTRGFERRGPWVSLFEIKGELYGGEVDFRGDRRIGEFMSAFPSVRNLLELGSLEGAHSFQLAPHVERLVAVEGRAESIERARYVQKLLGIENITFVEANLESVSLSDFGSFDAIFCVGLLYHLPEPWRLLDGFRDVAPQVFLETHYAANADKHVQSIGGRDYTEAGRADPLSGLSPLSFWMTLDEISARLRRNGYHVRVLRDEPAMKHGPLAAFVAER